MSCSAPRCVPGVQAVLKPLCSVFGGHVPEDDRVADFPQLYRKFGITRIQGLVAGAVGRLAAVAPGHELRSNRMAVLDRRVLKAEEARESAGVDAGELGSGHPRQERASGFGVGRCWIQTDRQVDVVDDVARVLTVGMRCPEGAELEPGILIEPGDLPGSAGIDSGPTSLEQDLAVSR